MANLPGDTERIEALTAGINRLTEKLDSTASQQQVVIHKQAGPGGLLAAAITACFSTLFIVVLVYLIVSGKEAADVSRIENQLRDHDAYIHMAREDIAKLKAANEKK